MLLCVQLRYVNMVSRAILIYPSGFNRSSNRDHLPSLSWKESPSSSCPIALPCSSWTYRNEYKRIVPAYASYPNRGLESWCSDQTKIDSHHIVFISKVQRSPTVSYDLSIAVDCKTVESSNKDYKLWYVTAFVAACMCCHDKDPSRLGNFICKENFTQSETSQSHYPLLSSRKDYL